MQNNREYLPRVAYWLVPRHPHREKLKTLIGALAERFSAPVFVPHVTVYSCRRSAQQQELAAMAALASQFAAVTLCPTGLASQDNLSQALFLKLREESSIRGLCQSLHAAVAHPSGYELAPHVSLLYQMLPVRVREELVRETSIPLPNILFDELWAVAIPGQLRQQGDFGGWQPLLICRLASGLIDGTIETSR